MPIYEDAEEQAEDRTFYDNAEEQQEDWSFYDNIEEQPGEDRRGTHDEQDNGAGHGGIPDDAQDLFPGQRLIDEHRNDQRVDAGDCAGFRRRKDAGGCGRRVRQRVHAWFRCGL